MLNDNVHGIECINQLNGKKSFIRGNHDSSNRISLYIRNGLEDLGHATILKYKKWRFYLSHFPTMVNNYDDSDKPFRARLINLCGHSHCPDRFIEFRKGIMSYHCELDAHNNTPIGLDEIIEDIKEYYN